ncbi:MAG TPA: tRNA pseudouridine(54/55) synthase Pus10 [Methanocella sp.]|uniref:tRNA pseudouridine(54/55) synthase Pus10 n=1 Tax=Methanocella sp. TaxID=2052833 RepID=UPI002BEDAAB6|nr:tRNA pseudouridine(54/55) synthase Pus10 [Methanocella sp.]HTY91193.1 tRNA pseudouridine(54/55) synthase Pus10 [Methanocella sp.]
MTIIETAKCILKEGPVCDSCLGRQFGKLSTGLSNAQRGFAIKTEMSMQAAADGDRETQQLLAPAFPQARKVLSIEGQDEECWLCRGLFQNQENIQKWAGRCIESVSGYEYDTLLVGTKVPPIYSEKEEVIWAECGIANAEPLKAELNREVGKAVSLKTGKEVDFKRPDVVFTIDLAADKVKPKVNSLFFYGRYKKYVRDIPQTRWPCRECGGRGRKGEAECEHCKGTGKMYPTSVEEQINHDVIDAFKAADAILHGAGREDIDGRMLGDGRPFVMEVIGPRIRWADLDALRERINAYASGKVAVSDLHYVDKDSVEQVKSIKPDKSYRLKVIYNDDISIETLKSSLATLSNSTIFQRTPVRVSHRRADLERKRKVHEITLEELNEADKYFVITVRCEGGLYVKELVSGDNGRTNPSLSALLGRECRVKELDVINVEGGISWQDHMVKEKRPGTSSQRR